MSMRLADILIRSYVNAMANHQYTTVEELASDEMFRQWVLEPTDELSAFWYRWMEENEERQILARQAKELVMAINEAFRDDFTSQMLEDEIEEITRMAEYRKFSAEPQNDPFPAFPFWRVAAVLVMFSIIGLLFVLNPPFHSMSDTAGKNSETAEPLIVRTNHSEKEMTVLLSDKSVATLTKGSSISYPKQFGTNERKVILEGEAFFDVSRNPEKPFLVYTSETVTRVLGTSFRVKALQKENTVMVLVKTGRVQVYPKNKYESQKGERHVSGVILDPNQQAVFNRTKNSLHKSVVSNPELLTELSTQKEMIFEDKPVAQVFRSLEEIYGIVIVYDAVLLSNCIINAHFSDENLKQRMNAICQAIGADYEIQNNRIIISSKGCN